MQGWIKQSAADYIVPLDALSMADVPRVGGKNASLGEMIANLAHAGVKVPGGFATTAQAFCDFLDSQRPACAHRCAAGGARRGGRDARWPQAGAEIRALGGSGGRCRPELEKALREAYAALSADTVSRGGALVGHRRGPARRLVRRAAGNLPARARRATRCSTDVRKVFASLYNDRAIAYRVHHGFAHAEVALSAGVQRMVRSDLAAAGVMFTLDTESGFRDVVFITSAYGLGETVVQGSVNPDEFYVHKPMLAQQRPAVVRRELGTKAIRMVWRDGATVIEDTPVELRRRFSLTDAEVLELARQAVTIENHYGRPMDIEWAKDGETASSSSCRRGRKR